MRKSETIVLSLKKRIEIRLRIEWNTNEKTEGETNKKKKGNLNVGAEKRLYSRLPGGWDIRRCGGGGGGHTPPQPHGREATIYYPSPRKSQKKYQKMQKVKNGFVISQINIQMNIYIKLLKGKGHECGNVVWWEGEAKEARKSRRVFNLL